MPFRTDADRARAARRGAPPRDSPDEAAVVSLALGPVQPKLTVGAAGDRFEQEADRVASAVVGHRRDSDPQPVGDMIAPTVRRQPISDEDDDAPTSVTEVRARRRGREPPPPVSSAFEMELLRAHSGGEPLAAPVRAPMEAAFGASFEAVRLHADNAGAGLAREIDASAFTVGSHIFLGAHRDISQPDGPRLLAHELTHVLQQRPQPGSGAARPVAPPDVVLRDTPAGSGGPEPPESSERQVAISFFGDDDRPMGSIPFAETLFASLEPGFYDCVISGTTVSAEGRTERFHVREVRPGGWQQLLGMTRRTVLVITDPSRKATTGEQETTPGSGERSETEPGTPGSGGSKYGWLGLIHLPASVTRALDQTIEALRLDEDIKEIRSLLSGLKDLYDHRSDLASLFTEEKLLGVLFGVDGGPGVDALERWALKPTHMTHAAGGKQKGVAALAAKLRRILETIRHVLRPVFRARKAFIAATAGFSEILEMIPLVEEVLTTSAEERRAPEFADLLDDVVDDVCAHVKVSLDSARAHLALVAESLTDRDWVTDEELARAVAALAEKFLPKPAKAVTWAASRVGIDIPGKIADHIVAPMIPKGALDEVNGVIRSALGALEPLVTSTTEAVDEVLGGIEADVHDIVAPELKTLFAQLDPLHGAIQGGTTPAQHHIEPELAASHGHPLPPDLELGVELGVDFADVRVHADAHAGRAAEALDAKAFTIGRDIFFGSARYAPSVPEGRRLLVHELTHVAQQAGGAAEPDVRRSPKDAVGGKLARASAARISAGVRALTTVSPGVVGRGREITTYVEKNLINRLVASRTLPADAYYYVRDKRNVPVGIPPEAEIRPGRPEADDREGSDPEGAPRAPRPGGPVEEVATGEAPARARMPG